MVDGWLAPAMTEAQADLYPFTVPHMPLSPKWRHPDRSRLSGEGKDLARTVPASGAIWLLGGAALQRCDKPHSSGEL